MSRRTASAGMSPAQKRARSYMLRLGVAKSSLDRLNAGVDYLRSVLHSHPDRCSMTAEQVEKYVVEIAKKLDGVK